MEIVKPKVVAILHRSAQSALSLHFPGSEPEIESGTAQYNHNLILQKDFELMYERMLKLEANREFENDGDFNTNVRNVLNKALVSFWQVVNDAFQSAKRVHFTMCRLHCFLILRTRL